MDNDSWNAAIDAAKKAIETAPIFTKNDLGPKADAEKIIILGTCIKRVEALKRICT